MSGRREKGAEKYGGEARFCCSPAKKKCTARVRLDRCPPETVPAKAATCTQTGLTEGSKCSVCGETLQEQETIFALGHDLGEWTVTREPTHSAEGEEQRICSRCGKEETQAIPVLEGLSGGETAGVAVGSTVGTMLLAYGVLALLFKKGIVTGAFFVKIFPFIKP